jgi:hypothetical protein
VEKAAAIGEYVKFSDEIKRSGHYIAADPLQSIRTAKTLTIKNGRLETTDGPYAETKEQLGGYYMIEAKDMDEAMAIAARIPGARIGYIEVRPILEVPNAAPR